MKINKKAFVLIGIAFLLIVNFYLLRTFWLTQAGSFLIYQDKIAPADAILVLGGGQKERVVQGLELWKEHFSDWLLFTGDHLEPVYGPPTHWALEAQKLAISCGVPKDKTIAILNSDSTLDDATLSKAVCLQKHFKSLIVISEPYHTKRSYFIFKKVYNNSGIKIMIYPVQNSWYKPNSWWKTKDGFWNTNIEYQKFVYYLFKGRLI